jgi:signal transduction histidine kinase
MTLRRRIAITALLLVLPAAALVVVMVEWLRGRDAQTALERVAAMHMTETVRDACQADPQWFLAGPRRGRPPLDARNIPDPDVHLPRPSPDPLPIDVFAYDHEYNPTSTAGPSLPRDLRSALRPPSPARSAAGTYVTPFGTGRQIAVSTGWTPGPCAVLLFRMQPLAGGWAPRFWMFAGVTALFFAVAYVAAYPTVRRMRRAASQAGAAARESYRSIAPDATKDDIGAMTFVYNEAAAEIHRRGAETKDRVEALRRFLRSAELDLAAPLASLETSMHDLAFDARLPRDAQDRVRTALLEAHGASRRLRNLVAAAELRMNNDPLLRQQTDLVQLVREVIREYDPIARAGAVHLEADLPSTPLLANVAGPMLALALSNAIDNAVRYNRPGGRVSVQVRDRAPAGFRIRILDTGHGVTDDEMKSLTAIRRFRGDESWNRRPGAPGLGLALSREIADRSGLLLELHRPAEGGFEVEITDAHS